MTHGLLKATLLLTAVGAMGVGMQALAGRDAEQRLLDRPREAGQRAGDAAGRTKETETVNRTIALPANGTVRVKNFSGDVRISPTTGREVVLKAIRRATRDVLDHVSLDVTASGSGVTIEANRRDPTWERVRHDSDVVDTDMEIQVPASADLDIDVFSSDVTVDGLSSDQRLKTFSGAITVRDLQGEIDAETFSGDIRVTMGKAAKGTVSFNSFSGSFNSDLPVSMTSIGRSRRNQFEGPLPAGDGPRLRFKTFSGNVELRTR